MCPLLANAAESLRTAVCECVCPNIQTEHEARSEIVNRKLKSATDKVVEEEEAAEATECVPKEVNRALVERGSSSDK